MEKKSPTATIVVPYFRSCETTDLHIYTYTRTAFSFCVQKILLSEFFITTEYPMKLLSHTDSNKS